MLGRLSGMFGANRPPGAKPRRSRVNLQRRFTVMSMTAQGSMSRVQRALDNQSGRTVCLKVQFRDKQQAAAARTSKDEARPEEGDIGLKITHPNVVRTFECGESTQGEHFVVMEFIDGVSLQYIRESNSADLGRKIDLLIQAAEGLAAIHQVGYIHHDINPRNFLVNREEQVKLIDFGLAVPNTPVFRRPGNRTGTLQYMAPELLRREPTDERLDIFSFGVVAFEFITGRLPYESAQANSLAMMLQRINHDPLDPTIAEPRLHPALAQILRRATARKKEDRYKSMRNLINDLEALPPEARTLDGSSRSTTSAPEPAREPVSTSTESFEFDPDQFLETSVPAEAPAPEADATAADAKSTGGVFMLKSGPKYMIRKSRHFDRRVKMIQRQFGDKVELVHMIPAVDIDRAESYWHERFKDRRESGEWFALSDDQVAEFKACTEMPFDH